MMSSNTLWRHAICEACWHRKNPTRRAVRLKEPDNEVCCWCFKSTRSGIYVREDPELVRCQGKVGYHEEKVVS